MGEILKANYFEAPKSDLKRLAETYDPQVSRLFDGEQTDRVGNLIEHLHELTLKQKVHSLLLLTDNEFDEFRERRKGGSAFELLQVKMKKGELTRKEYIETVSQLRDANPRFETEAEIRRRWGGKYPAVWDMDLEEDIRFKSDDGLLRLRDGKRISYEEAIEFTRFEKTRSWYRNVFFSQISRRDNPLPLTLSTLVKLFKKEKSEIFDPEKPGTNISIEDLLKVLDYYQFEHESDNEENCAIHRQVKKLAETVKEFDNVIERKK